MRARGMCAPDALPAVHAVTQHLLNPPKRRSTPEGGQPALAKGATRDSPRAHRGRKKSHRGDKLDGAAAAPGPEEVIVVDDEPDSACAHTTARCLQLAQQCFARVQLTLGAGKPHCPCYTLRIMRVCG
jgi:hypothetical protein